MLSHYDNWNAKSKIQQRYKVATKKSSEWMNKDSRQRFGFTFKSLVHFVLKDPVLKALYPISPVLKQHQRDVVGLAHKPLHILQKWKCYKNVPHAAGLDIWSLKVKPLAAELSSLVFLCPSQTCLYSLHKVLYSLN